MVIVVGAVFAVVLSGCSSSESQSSAVATEIVYVDPQGNPVDPRGNPVAPLAPADSAVPTPTRAPVAQRYFQTPDGQIKCGSDSMIAGSYGGYEGRPEFVCLGGASSIPRPNLPGCSPGVTQIGGAAAIGPGWVARGVCTGGWVFNRSPDAFAATAVGDRIDSGGTVCSIHAADTVSCDSRGHGFTLSATAVTARGNDVTRD